MKRQGIQAKGGFTVVEVVMVMAITALLLAGIIASSAGSQRYPQFTANIDQLQIAAKALQNDANATISTRASGGNSPYIVFGKAMIFNYNSPTTYTVATLINKDGDSTDPLAQCDISTEQLPGQINYAPNKISYAIVFRHDPDQLYAAILHFGNFPTAPSGVCSSPGLALKAAAPTTHRTAVGANIMTNLLNRLAPPAYATNPCNDILNLSNYTLGNCNGPQSIDFTNPADPNQVGTLNVDPTNDVITRSFNY